MTKDPLHQQAWDFFEMQAGQRLTTFNFYIALSSLLSGSLVASFKADIALPYLGVLLGFLLVLFSFAFWKLDSRNRDLIRGAEATLKFFETEAPFQDEADSPHIAKLFSREKFDTNALKSDNSWCLWRNHYSYSWCFRIVFVTFAALGVIGAGLSVLWGAAQP